MPTTYKHLEGQYDRFGNPIIEITKIEESKTTSSFTLKNLNDKKTRLQDEISQLDNHITKIAKLKIPKQKLIKPEDEKEPQK